MPSLAVGTSLISGWQADDRWCHCLQESSCLLLEFVRGQVSKGRDSDPEPEGSLSKDGYAQGLGTQLDFRQQEAS